MGEGWWAWRNAWNKQLTFRSKSTRANAVAYQHAHLKGASVCVASVHDDEELFDDGGVRAELGVALARGDGVGA